MVLHGKSGVFETQGHHQLHRDFHTIRLQAILSLPTFFCPATTIKIIIENGKVFLCKAVELKKKQTILMLWRRSWGYMSQIISGNRNSSEGRKLKRSGYSKKQIGIDQLGFSRHWWIICDSLHTSLWLWLSFCGKRTTAYTCW